MNKTKIFLALAGGFVIGAIVSFWFFALGLRLFGNPEVKFCLIANQAQTINELFVLNRVLADTKGIEKLNGLRADLEQERQGLLDLLNSDRRVLGLPQTQTNFLSEPTTRDESEND
ncbi:MAG TPA: hypothetical protein VMG59_01400 [Phycisphaerae bacterium]|nr:hypothetical protein [Phycisphaerae bacterium]